MTGATIAVTGLYYYPIKGCRGYALQTAVLDERGIVDDRRFLIVDAKDRFVTQREHPQLALIAPCVEPRTLSLTAPGTQPVTIDTHSPTARRTVTIWRDTVEAIDQGEAAARWLSEYLGEPVRLVKFADDVLRKVNADYARRPTDQTGFADGYPLLLITQESLNDLNSRLSAPRSGEREAPGASPAQATLAPAPRSGEREAPGASPAQATLAPAPRSGEREAPGASPAQATLAPAPLPMNRFRPNLVISGAGPYAEDTWKQIRIGAMLLDIVKPCARCVVTTTDQASAERGKEPLATLATYRASERGVLFGQNVIHAGPGTLKLGQRVEIIH
jgi:hypothetical protein